VTAPKAAPQPIEKGFRSLRNLLVGLESRIGTLSEPVRRIALGYVVVLLFFLGLFVLLSLRTRRASSLFDDPTVVLVLSIVVILPLVIEFLRPIVSTVKFGAVELTFREVAARSAAVTENLEKLGEISGSQIVTLAESYYPQTLAIVSEMNKSQAEVAKVNLGSSTTRTWKYPNLYFLALLLELRSGARELLFVHLGDDGVERYLTMCAPGALRQRLGELFPQLESAAEKWKAGQALATTQVSFSKALQEVPATKPKRGTATSALAGSVLIGKWVNPNDLMNLMGLNLNRCSVEWKERLSREDLRTILSCSHSHIAVTQDGHLALVLDQNRVALTVARNAT
jgi:hypothetical protein